MAIGGVGELEAKDFGVFLRLLQTLAGRIGFRLGLDYGNGKITGVTQDIIGPFLLPSSNKVSPYLNAPIGEGLLFGDGMWVLLPARFPKLGGHIDPAGIRFIQRHPLPLMFS